MTLILNNEEVEKVLTMDDCLEVLEDAFRDLGRDTAVNQIRVHTYVSMEQSPLNTGWSGTASQF
jgi:ornithine cyclodeaminase/alanine dehydrogenase-like protein (mu-crystallin family)